MVSVHHQLQCTSPLVCMAPPDGDIPGSVQKAETDAKEEGAKMVEGKVQVSTSPIPCATSSLVDIP